MCDYSLELYQSRPARAGERYETYRFPSGSIGFVVAGEGDVAICMACDTRLKLTQLPLHLRRALGVDEAEVTFVHIERGPYHDGIRWKDGAEITLQQLGPGVEAYLIDDLSKVRADTHGTLVPAE